MAEVDRLEQTIAQGLIRQIFQRVRSAITREFPGAYIVEIMDQIRTKGISVEVQDAPSGVETVITVRIKL